MLYKYKVYFTWKNAKWEIILPAYNLPDAADRVRLAYVNAVVYSTTSYD